MKNHKTLKCPRCGKLFKLGYTGARSQGADSMCDECQGIERDADGTIWLPGETSAEFVAAGAPLDQSCTVQRPETRKSWRR
jgi:hypothetical protein